MHNTAMKLFVLASFVCLALCAPKEEGAEPANANGDQTPLAVKCCESEIALPHIFDNVGDCLESDDREDVSDEEQSCTTIECILSAKEVLNEDKSVKEVEFKKLVLDRAHLNVTTVVSDALEKCFAEYKNKRTSATLACKSGVDKLFNCNTREILMHCPTSLWRKNDPQCKVPEQVILEKSKSTAVE